MKKYSYLIIIVLISSLVLTGCSLLSNISQVPATDQIGITYLTKNGLLTGLVGLWSFDEGKGDTAYDSSGNGNHGTVYGASWVDGKFDNALSFDGVDDYVEVADHSSLQVQELTIEAWVNLDTLPGRQIIIRKSIDSVWGSFSLQVEQDGHLRLTVQDKTNGKWPVWRTKSPLAAGGWYHVAGTFKKQNYDASDGKIYVNGSAQTTDFTANGYTFGFMIEYTAGGFFIGMQHGQSYPLDGTIDEVRIWKTALTSDMIEDHVEGIYGFNGLMAPYAPPEQKAFKAGSTIPLKWQYTDSSGEVFDSIDANPKVKYQFDGAANNNNVPVFEFADDPGSSGLRYDSLTMTWQFNWQTKGRDPGNYKIWITSLKTGQVNGPFRILLK